MTPAQFFALLEPVAQPTQGVAGDLSFLAGLTYG